MIDERRFSNPAATAADGADGYVRALLDLLGERDPFEVQEELIDALVDATEDLDEEVVRTPEATGKWSIVEVIQHLADSELVYGYRMRLIVAEEEPEIPGYDQDRWARNLRYRDVGLDSALQQLDALRRANLRWLRTLSEAELDRFGHHGERGEESVRHIIRLLAAHDLVHRRQIDRIKHTLGLAG